MANNLYSIIINDKRYGFFHSTRGLNKGEPLSPALFILGVEVLSKTLNQLKRNPEFHGFYMEKEGQIVNNLSFADDYNLFTSGRAKTLYLIMQTLKDYEDISCQMVNGDKCHFMVYPNVFDTTRDRIKKNNKIQTKSWTSNKFRMPNLCGWT